MILQELREELMEVDKKSENSYYYSCEYVDESINKSKKKCF